MQIEIVGKDAEQLTQELLAIDGVEGSYEILDEVYRGEVITTIASVVAITVGTLTIAEKMHGLYGKYKKSQNPSSAKIEKVMIVKGGHRLLLKDPTVDQIKEILDG